MNNIDMGYYFKGSTNCTLSFRENEFGTQLVTDYNEVIATVTNGHELLEVLQKLANDELA